MPCIYAANGEGNICFTAYGAYEAVQMLRSGNQLGSRSLGIGEMDGPFLLDRYRVFSPVPYPCYPVCILEVREVTSLGYCSDAGNHNPGKNVLNIDNE